MGCKASYAKLPAGKHACDVRLTGHMLLIISKIGILQEISFDRSVLKFCKSHQGDGILPLSSATGRQHNADKPFKHLFMCKARAQSPSALHNIPYWHNRDSLYRMYRMYMSRNSMPPSAASLRQVNTIKHGNQQNTYELLRFTAGWDDISNQRHKSVHASLCATS